MFSAFLAAVLFPEFLNAAALPIENKNYIQYVNVVSTGSIPTQTPVETSNFILDVAALNVIPITGINATCSGTQIIQAPVISSGIVTGGSCAAQAGGGGGASTLGVYVGTVQVSSPTAQITFNSGSFNGSLASPSTAQINLNPVSLSTGVTGSLPAASVAAGSLGSQVIASSVAATGITIGSYGSATQSPTYTVGVDGRLTAASNVTITGTVPGGTAGGDLTGTYPNPTLKAVQGNVTTFSAAVTDTSSHTITGSGGLLVTYGITAGTMTLTALSSNTIVGVNSGTTTVSVPALSNGGLIIGGNGIFPSTGTLTGTANQVIVTNAAGSVTLSLPQSINSGATPTFAGTNFTSIPAASINAGTLGSQVIASSVAATNIGASATVGSATQSPQITYGVDGRLTAASNITISGTAPGGNAGGDLTGTYPNPTLAAVQGNVTTFTGPITNTSTSSATFNGPISISSGAAISNLPIKTANYTMTSLDEVIFASAAPVALGITITLPAASSKTGQIVQIWKVDLSSQPVTIQAAGSDTIISTATYTLNAKGQGGLLMSDGSGTWYPWGRFNYNPPYVGAPNLFASAAASLNASSDTVTSSFTVDSPILICAYRYGLGTLGGANVNLGVWDQNGILIASTGPVVGALETASLSVAKPFRLSPGNYEAGIQVSNTTATVNKVGTNAPYGCYQQATGGGLALPNPLSFATTSSRCPAIQLQACGGPWTQ